MSVDISIKKHFPAFTLDVSFSAGNEVFGLLGASGCGKSLTMRSIAGIETPDEGHIVVNGKTFFDSEKGINLSPQQRKTALLFQNYMLFPNLTVAQNVGAGVTLDADQDAVRLLNVPGRFAKRRALEEKRDRIVSEELARFDLSSFGERYPAQLSGGQQQRVALARMLAAHPDILMLDEPFSALDSHLKSVLEQNLAGLFEVFDGTIIYVSHDIDEAVRFCDTIAVIDAGKIAEIDGSRQLIDGPQSEAGLKISGCKNVQEAHYVDSHHVYCPYWGITLATEQTVPENVRAMGLRAFHPYRVEEPGENVFRVRVARVSDSRFDRTAIVEFLDRSSAADGMVDATEQVMHYLHQRLFWRVDRFPGADVRLPERDEELLLHIPPSKVVLVTR